MNVLSGERYQTVASEIRAYVRGEYGRPPGEINPELMEKVLNGEKPIEGRFAETLKPQFEEAKRALKGLARSDEDVLSYLAFPQIAEKFLKERDERESTVVSYTIREG
jgi:oxaloacetate decarboxylase alpha subunit